MHSVNTFSTSTTFGSKLLSLFSMFFSHFITLVLLSLYLLSILRLSLKWFTNLRFGEIIVGSNVSHGFTTYKTDVPIGPTCFLGSTSTSEFYQKHWFACWQKRSVSTSHVTPCAKTRKTLQIAFRQNVSQFSLVFRVFERNGNALLSNTLQVMLEAIVQTRIWVVHQGFRTRVKNENRGAKSRGFCCFWVFGVPWWTTINERLN